jgi:tripartite-type tricarboxylate transporter receptor subunit TctC
MKLTAFKFFCCLLGATLAAPSWSADADWPQREVTINVGHAGGGSYDAMARKIAEALTADLGQPFIVVSRPGAGGIVMQQAIGRSRPDGYQIGFATSLNLTLDAQAGVTPFDARTVEPLASVARVQSVLMTNSKQPFDDIAGLAKFAAAKGYALFGKQALVDELVGRAMMKADKVQYDFVSYKGGSEVRLALLSGQIDFGYVGGGYKGDVDSGALKILATTDARRLAAYPKVPTLRELGYPISEESVGLFVVPAGMPEPLKQKLALAIAKAAAKPEVRAFIADTLLMVPEVKYGDELKAQIKAQEALWAGLLAAQPKQ